MAEKPTTRLRELRSSGYEVKTGQPDIRGWDVREENGRKIGKVRELIFDIKAKQVRYMVIDILDVRELELEKRTVLVPIGLAQLDSSDDDVILQGVTPFQLRALPRYDKSSLGAKVERDISQVFGRQHTLAGTGTATTEDVGDSFYEHDHFNENNLNKRRGVVGSIKDKNELQREEARRLEQRREEERRAEKEALRHEAELGQPVTFTDPDDLRRAERRSDETEEEWRRRTRKNNL